MIFNSLIFAIFLPTVFLLYWFVFNKNLKLQNLLIVIVSYFFYGWWDWRFLSLLFFSSVIDFLVGLFLEKSNNPTNRKLLLSISIIGNLGLLGFFKYYNFFVDSFIEAGAKLGFTFHESTLNIILPVGISFYTFQTLSYGIDVYRRQLATTKDFVSFMAFVSFFPQLVAGPIERASNLLPQFEKKREFDLEKAKDGLRQMLWGLIKKVVIADTLAIEVDRIFSSSSYENLPGISLAIGSIFFVFQIYCDFSGYSDIGIGTARLFGFDLMRNFAYPFFSRNIGEFWQRWHISLSTWFRDYVFIPLGGNRGTKYFIIRNILFTYILSGLWHGANWTYIIWGVLNGLFYLPLIFMQKRNRKYSEIVAFDRNLPSIKELLQIIITFMLFTFSMIFFRSENLSRSLDYFYFMISNLTLNSTIIIDWILSKSFIIIIILIIVEWIQRKKQHAMAFDNFPKTIRWSLYFTALIIFFYFGEFEQSFQFIYFQF